MSKGGKTILAIMAILVLLGLLLFYRFTTQKEQPVYSEGVRLSSSDRIMVVAPHPDDETLGCGGVLRRALEKKIPALVVVMNNGDGYKRAVELYFKTVEPGPDQFRELGFVRHQETINAMKQLGLGEKNIFFLSYPDGGTNSLFDVNWDSSNLHRGMNGATHAPYAFSYEKGAPYCGENVVKNLEEIIRRFRPSVIFYPDPEDAHHDHWATSAFLEYVLNEIKYKGSQFTYLVHRGFDWPYPWRYAPQRQLLPPSELFVLDAKWMLFPLSKDEEALKHEAVDLYRSQADLMEPFLEAFVRKNELFADYPDKRVARVRDKPDFFSGKRLPHAVFGDPPRDTIIRELEGFGDLTGVGFVLQEKDAWLAIEVRRRIASDLVYAFHLRIFEKNATKRLDIKIQFDGAATEALARNSVMIEEPIFTQRRGDRIVIRIPAKLFGDADRLLLSADSYNHNQKRIDRTAWRTLILR